MRVEASTGLDFSPILCQDKMGRRRQKYENRYLSPEEKKSETLFRFELFSDGLRRSSEIFTPVSRCVDTELRTRLLITMFKSLEKLVKADFVKNKLTLDSFLDGNLI